jgi:hypothetical protein
MKEYEKRAPDSAEQDAPQDALPMKKRRSSSGSGGEHLSHPANAEPLADLMGQLQHDYGNAYVQRVVSGLRDERPNAGPTRDAAPKPESVQPLDTTTRGEMESAFGESLDDVRLHTGEQAEEAARGLGARAFTRGRDIYFNEGEYDPATRDGKELLAHELTHVIQQSQASAQEHASSADGHDKFEEEADRAARAALSGERAPVLNRSAAPSVQRQPTTGQPPAQQPAQQPSGGGPVIVVNVNPLARGNLPHRVKYDPTLTLVDPDAEVLILEVPPGATVTPLSTAIKEFNDTGSPLRSRTISIRIGRVPGQPTQFPIRFTVGQHHFEARFIFPPRP